MQTQTTERDALERRIQQIYRQIQQAAALFLKGIEGSSSPVRERCGDWIITHLMVLFFLQQRGFLDGNPRYLQEQFAASEPGRHLFYRGVLLPLLGRLGEMQQRPREQPPQGYIPAIPALFACEELWPELMRLQISDEAFAALFACFSAFRWLLDDRETQPDGITPQLVAYLLEKRLEGANGSFYTPDNVAEYIARSSIVPALFDRIRRKAPAYFDPASVSSIWWRLAQDPDRYLFDAVKKGVQFPLPPEIAAGQESVSQRAHWDKAAAAAYGLPTETWREVVERRRHCEEVRAALAGGKVTGIDAFVTFNLNVRLFAQDVIERCSEPEFILAWYEALAGTDEGPGLSILDPTCGAGAFLQAALAVLEPLYTACLERMQALLARSPLPYNLNYFQLKKIMQVLELERQHPNLVYFVRKLIITNNLYGVDITEEAVDTCRVCLLLKLIAVVEQVEDLAALPDLDYTIYRGNALVGVATADGLRHLLLGSRETDTSAPHQPSLFATASAQESIADPAEQERIEWHLRELGQLAYAYRHMQLEHRRAELLQE